MHHNQSGHGLPRRTPVRRAIGWLRRYRRVLVLRALYGAAYGASTTAASLFLVWLHTRL